MNYSALKKCDISNGLGWRLSLWCSGCSRHCPQCFNPEAQDPAFGRPFTVETKQKIWRELSDPHCSGLSLLGGEPLYATNRATITDLCREAKEKFPTKDIWMWSGWTIEEIMNDGTMKPILNYIDVLVDSPFIVELKDLSTPFRGSTNQRIWNIAKWRETGELRELELK